MITDSDALGYLVSQLEYIEPKVWEKKYTPIIYQDLVPISFEAGEWATSIAVHYMDGVAEGRFIGSAGDDIPFTRIDTGRDQVPVAYGGIGFEYTLDELRIAQHLGRPIDAEKGRIAFRGYEEHAQRIAFFGDSTRGMSGLLNHADIPITPAGATFSGSSADVVLGIINTALTGVWSSSKGVEKAGCVVLPLAQFGQIATQRVSTQSDTTVLEYIRQKNVYTALTGQPLQIKVLDELTGAGAGAVDRMLVYANTPDVLTYHIPLPYRLVAPQPVNLTIRVPAEYKLAGLEVRYPGALRYVDGV